MRLESLKYRMRRSGFPVVEKYPAPATLAKRVQSDLWRLIDETFPADTIPDVLALERQRHEAYGAPRRRLYLGGEEYFRALYQGMGDGPHRPVLITGQSGGGKGALLANWVARCRNWPA